MPETKRGQKKLTSCERIKRKLQSAFSARIQSKSKKAAGSSDSPLNNKAKGAQGLPPKQGNNWSNDGNKKGEHDGNEDKPVRTKPKTTDQGDRGEAYPTLGLSLLCEPVSDPALLDGTHKPVTDSLNLHRQFWSLYGFHQDETPAENHLAGASPHTMPNSESSEDKDEWEKGHRRRNCRRNGVAYGTLTSRRIINEESHQHNVANIPRHVSFVGRLGTIKEHQEQNTGNSVREIGKDRDEDDNAEHNNFASIHASASQVEDLDSFQLPDFRASVFLPLT